MNASLARSLLASMLVPPIWKFFEKVTCPSVLDVCPHVLTQEMKHRVQDEAIWDAALVLINSDELLNFTPGL